MEIAHSVIEKINNAKSRARIAASLGCGDQVLAVHIKKNRANGRLTKMDALLAISKETDLPIDEILFEGVTKVQ